MKLPARTDGYIAAVQRIVDGYSATRQWQSTRSVRERLTGSRMVRLSFVLSLPSSLSLDLESAELGRSQVLKDWTSLADRDPHVIVLAFNQVFAATLADEIETLPQASVRVRLVRIICAVEGQLIGEEL